MYTVAKVTIFNETPIMKGVFSAFWDESCHKSRKIEEFLENVY